MSQENVELAKILLPQPGTDVVPLIRDEDTYARMAEAARPFLTDDFESVMVWPVVNRTYAGPEGLRKNQWALLPLRVRGLERVQLHADLTILAKLSCALARAQAVPLAA